VFAGIPVTFSQHAESDRPAGFSLRHKLVGRYAHFEGMDQFSICCRRAGIAEAVKLDLRWKVANRGLVERIRRKAAGRPVLVYQPRKRNNEMSPEPTPFYAWVRKRSDCYRVRVGHPKYVESVVSECELDLFGKTEVADILDVATAADLFFGDLCYLGIVADALGKPSVCMLSRQAIAQPEWCHLTAQRMFRNANLATLDFD
jgi:hypothetical protein